MARCELLRDSGGDSRFVNGLYVSGEFFHVLGINPVRGRLLYSGRRPARLRTPRRHNQLWLLAAGVRRPPRAGTKAETQRQAHENHRYHAAKFLWRGCWQQLRCGRSHLRAACPRRQEPARIPAPSGGSLVIGQARIRHVFPSKLRRIVSLSPGIFASTLRPDYPAEREGLPRDEVDRRAFCRGDHAPRNVFRIRCGFFSASPDLFS